ncbi:hypothetical protein KDL44_09945 [bacterium]|nr:hypothetical protein [bacterium]
MDQQESSGDITRQQLGGMTNKERFHEGRSIPKQLRRVCWELWSPVVTSEDEPDDWQMLEVLDWYLIRRKLGSSIIQPQSISRNIVYISSILLIGLAFLLITIWIGGVNLTPWNKSVSNSMGWDLSDIIIFILMLFVASASLASLESAKRQRRELQEKLVGLDVLELVPTVYGSPISQYDLVQLPALVRGQHDTTERMNARMMADNLELFLGMDGVDIRRRLMNERILTVLRGFAIGSGFLLIFAPFAAFPLFFIAFFMIDGSNLFTNRRHELLLAMLDEMYPDGTAGAGKL